jgi:hypothetical protein
MNIHFGLFLKRQVRMAVLNGDFFTIATFFVFLLLQMVVKRKSFEVSTF